MEARTCFPNKAGKKKKKTKNDSGKKKKSPSTHVFCQPNLSRGHEAQKRQVFSEIVNSNKTSARGSIDTTKTSKGGKVVGVKIEKPDGKKNSQEDKKKVPEKAADKKQLEKERKKEEKEKKKQDKALAKEAKKISKEVKTTTSGESTGEDEEELSPGTTEGDVPHDSKKLKPRFSGYKK